MATMLVPESFIPRGSRRLIERWLPSLGLAGLVLLFSDFLACGGGGRLAEGSGPVGQAVVAVSLIPPATGCIVIQVVGTATLDFQYNVAPESSATFDLTGLPLGQDTFTASSYTKACLTTPQATLATVAAFTSNSPTAAVLATSAVPVDLFMGGSTGGAIVTINFQTPGSITEYAPPTPPGAVCPCGVFGITAGPDGNLWFTAISTITTASGWYVGSMTTSGVGVITANNANDFPSGADQLGDITAGPDGNLWFGAGEGGADIGIGRVTSGGLVTEFSLSGSGSEPYHYHETAGPDGNVWFAETGIPNASVPAGIVRVTPQGVITNFAVSGAVYGIAAGSDGNLWSIDAQGANIFVMSTSGVLVSQYAINNGGVPTCPVVLLSVLCGSGIAAGADGNLWFTTGNSVGSITTSGNITLYTIPTPSSGPIGITAGPDGNIWFTEAAANQIGRITLQSSSTLPQYTITEFSIPTPNSYPLNITAGSDGNLWFTEVSAGKIGMLAIF